MFPLNVTLMNGWTFGLWAACCRFAVLCLLLPRLRQATSKLLRMTGYNSCADVCRYYMIYGVSPFERTLNEAGGSLDQVRMCTPHKACQKLLRQRVTFVHAYVVLWSDMVWPDDDSMLTEAVAQVMMFVSFQGMFVCAVTDQGGQIFQRI